MKTTISKKNQDELYALVHEEIMNVRLKIWNMRNDKCIVIAEIDDILSNLCINLPEKALSVFQSK